MRGAHYVVLFAPGQLDEIQAEAKRLDRSVSWLVQQAWWVARARLRAAPIASSVAAAGTWR